jgi:DNA-binding CsgD family transcriptional regulator
MTQRVGCQVTQQVSRAKGTIEGAIPSGYVPSRVRRGAEALVGARGDARRLKAVFRRSRLPMIMVDARRRPIDVNQPAQLWFRLSLDQLRGYTIDDLAAAGQAEEIERSWARIIDAGCVAGRSTAGPEGSRVEIVYFAVAHVLPGLHAGVFAPADWSEDDPNAIEVGYASPAGSLTAREIELLALAAGGLSGPEAARELGLSRATVSTHFKNIHEKLGVRTRAAAVAKAMRHGLLD